MLVRVSRTPPHILAAALLVVPAVASPAAPAAAPAAAKPASAGAGTAAGTMTADGKTTPIAHGFAYAKTSNFGGSTDDVVVVLTDVAVSAADEKDDAARLKLALAGKLNALEITIDPEGKINAVSVVNGGGTLQLTGSDHTFEKNAMGGGRIAGKVASKGKIEKYGASLSDEATFDLPVTAKTAPATAAPSAADSAKIEASEQGKVVIAYMKAIKAGDKAAIKSMVQPDMAAQLDGPEGKDILEMLQALMPAKPTFSDLAVDGDTATVTLIEKAEGSTSTSKVKLVRMGGAWKVGK